MAGSFTRGKYDEDAAPAAAGSVTGYGELKRSSSHAWDEVKVGFARSYDAMRDSLVKAAKEF